MLHALCRLECEQLGPFRGGHECWCCPAITRRLLAHCFQSESSLLAPAVREKGEEPRLHFVYVQILKPALDPAHCAYLLHFIACIALLSYFLHHSRICSLILFSLSHFRFSEKCPMHCLPGASLGWSSCGSPAFGCWLLPQVKQTKLKCVC